MQSGFRLGERNRYTRRPGRDRSNPEKLVLKPQWNPGEHVFPTLFAGFPAHDFESGSGRWNPAGKHPSTDPESIPSWNPVCLLPRPGMLLAAWTRMAFMNEIPEGPPACPRADSMSRVTPETAGAPAVLFAPAREDFYVHRPGRDLV